MAKYQAFINSINIYAPDDIKHFLSRNIKNVVRLLVRSVVAGEEIYANFIAVDKYVAGLMDFP